MKLELAPEVKEQIPKGYRIDLKTYLIMEYTARVVNMEGGNFEFKLKIHPDADLLPFLDPKHELHKCYQFLKENEKYNMYNTKIEIIPEQLRELFKSTSTTKKKEEIDTHPNAYNIVQGYSDSD